jgi:hypothetical protein
MSTYSVEQATTGLHQRQRFGAIAVGVALLAAPAFAQPVPEWTYTHPGSHLVIALGPQQQPIALGSIGYGGYVTDLLLTQLPPTGPPPTWATTVDIAERDHPSDLAIGSAGECYVAAQVGDANGSDFCVLQLSPNGTPGWQYRSNGSNSATALALDPDREVLYAAGGGWLVKLAYDGTVLWERSRPSSNFYDVVLDADGSPIVAGSEANGLLVAKITQSGDEQWAYRDTEGWFSRIVRDDQGFIHAAGIRVTQPLHLSAIVVKLSADGSEIWRSGYSSYSEDAGGVDLALDTENNAYLSARTVGFEWSYGVVVRINGQNGQGDWVQLFADGQFPHNSIDQVAVRGDRVYALGSAYQTLKLYQLSAETGDPDWVYEMPAAEGRDMALDSSAIYLCGNGFIQKLHGAVTALEGVVDARAVPQLDGILLSWRTPGSTSPYLGFHVERADAPEGSFARITNDPLVGAHGRFAYFDRNIDGGHEYRYRLVGMRRDGTEDIGTDVLTARATAFAGLRIEAPNPLREGAEIVLSVPARAPVDLEIFDVSGRCVRQLIAGASITGVRRVIWDGTDGTGRRLSRGIYFLRAETPQASTATKVVIADQ